MKYFCARCHMFMVTEHVIRINNETKVKKMRLDNEISLENEEDWKILLPKTLVKKIKQVIYIN